jgi:pimeloyl-ACP methyl ester carboxylesterase
MKELRFKGINIRYQDQGEGETVVLLHGYLESLEIWNGFAGELGKSFRIIRPDLPGHGKSGVIGETHDMELHADAIRQILDEEKVDRCTLIGHSLGGYVTLAFLDKYPDRIRRFSLFHSHPFADSETVKANRKREIHLVQNGEKNSIFEVNIPKAFADENLEKLPDDLQWAKDIAYQTPGEGITANLKGMMQRPDRSLLLKETMKPFLLIAGRKDKYIDYDTVIPKIGLPEQGKLVTLESSGHLGFVEEQKKSLEIIYDFMKES